MDRILLIALVVTFVTASAFGVEGTAARSEPLNPRDALPLLGDEISLPEVAFGDIEQIRVRRELRVLVSYSRTNFFFDRAQPRGAAYELFTAAVRDLNRRQPRSRWVRLSILPVPRENLLPWLVDGRGDVAAGSLTVTSERAAVVDFTDPLSTGVREVVVTRRGDGRLRTLRDLSGQDVHVRLSSSYHASLELLSQQLLKEGREPVRIVPVEESLEDEDLLELLDSGAIGITVVDDHLRHLWGSLFKNIVFREDIRLRDGANVAWAIRKGSPDLQRFLSGFIHRARKAGTLAVIGKRYFVDNRWARRSISAGELRRFDDIVNHFRYYASRYSFDWMKLLSQGYQESGLDQSARNSSGAVGIMQILPATAADPAIDIPDISTAEPNIHAGMKYMRYLMDRYLDDPAIDPTNRFLLALASYNAGPNRIRTLRERTRKAGLDPNKWFGNVEIQVARSVGSETVDYVANILRYLTAYQLAFSLLPTRPIPEGR